VPLRRLRHQAGGLQVIILWYIFVCKKIQAIKELKFNLVLLKRPLAFLSSINDTNRREKTNVLYFQKRLATYIEAISTRRQHTTD
jgi:hypothetical protein